MPREETLSKLEKCHVLIHPSLHDSGGWVCSEMMAAGRPVICLDLGGPAVQVTEETGFKISSSSPDLTVRNMSKAMVVLAQDTQLRMRMGIAGQKLVSESYSWQAKVKHLATIYPDIINSNKNEYSYSAKKIN